MKLHLKTNEELLRKILVGCCGYIKTEANVDVTLRMAGLFALPLFNKIGGWVRDKLLNIQSHDIDVAIDKMTGFQFATYLNTYCIQNGLNSHKIAKIEVNPEKSKHLETATMRLCDLDLDFVNLRTESYQDHSRIPDVSFGTPLDDALRRDCTINSLFFNLHTQEVEDFTKMGLEDLKNRIIRTPLEPIQTLLDDPLRVLRIIRFASRIGSAIDPICCDATKSTIIQEAFAKKISRERVGVEVEKMLNGPDPLRSIWILIDFGYHNLVFLPPYNVQTVPTDAVKVAYAIHWLAHSNWKSKVLPSYHSNLDLDGKKFDSKLLFLSAALFPFGNRTYETAKMRIDTFARFIVSNSLKLSNLEADQTSSIQSIYPLIQQLVTDLKTEPTSITRKNLGFLLRKMGLSPLGKDWGLVVFFALSVDLLDHLTVDMEKESVAFHKVDVFSHGCGILVPENDEIIQIIDGYVKLFELIRSMGLERGKEVAKILDLKPGKTIGLVLESVMDWQISYKGKLFKDEQEANSPASINEGLRAFEDDAVELCKKMILETWKK